MFLAEFIAVTTISLLAIMTPGPDFAIISKNSLIHSRKSGLYTLAGVLLADITQVFFALVGIGLLITQSVLLFNIVKYAGAIYLIYIGIKALRAKPQPVSQMSEPVRRPTISPLRAVRTGFLTSILNPKAALFFLSIFTQVIQPGTPLAIRAVFGVEVVAIAGVWFFIVVMIFSHHRVQQRFARVQHWAERAMGAVLVALGLRIATDSK